MELNARPTTVIRDGVVVSIPWSEVAVGDLLEIKQDEFFPADIVLLHASTPGGMAYVETSNLDGCVHTAVLLFSVFVFCLSFVLSCAGVVLILRCSVLTCN